ncbi:MAG TPA: DUF2461 family protein [Candidatus Acidoferrales bacterium]|nr:DUF2461 family protein [Candidatus Acidoferrales bacterium]
MVQQTSTGKTKAAFPQGAVRFFRELSRNNNKPWMDANRDRYRAEVVEPFRVMLDALAPAARKLDSRFVISGRVNDNFSRINRDIRFARDKTPYRPQMYLFFCEAGDDAGQLYVGVGADVVTCGFRIYGGRRVTPLVQFGRPRGLENAKWLARQKNRLDGKFESYWYSTQKGEWTKHGGWPVEPENWKKLQAWIVRRTFSPAAASRDEFRREAARIFKEVHPLMQFASSPQWKG